jgi:ATP adenylyltransferase
MASTKYPDILYPLWRYEYTQIAAMKQQNADPFRGLRTVDEKKMGIVKRGKLSCLMLNRFPYAPGHLLVVPYRKVPEIEKLTKPELDEIMELVVLGKKLLERTMHTHGCNIGLNQGESILSGGSVPNHLHFHIVPRWRGDSNFMPVVARTRILVRSSENIRVQMKKALKEMESPKPRAQKPNKRASSK